MTLNVRALCALFFITLCLTSYAQCPTGNVTGNVTINSNCNIAAGANYTITGNLTLNANLTLGAGAKLTVTGTLNNSYVGSATTRTISGGTVEVGTATIGDNYTLNLSGTTLNVTNGYTGGYHGGLTMTNAVLDIGTSFSEGFQQGTITLNNSDISTGTTFATSGGGTQLSLTNGSSIDAGTSFSFTGGSGRTLTVNNSSINSGTNFTIGEQSGSNITNGSSLVVGGNFLNDNGADMILDNSTITLTSGNFMNDFQATILAQNGSDITLSNGNMNTEDQSSLIIDASDVYINGDMNNDFHAQLTVRNNGTLTVTGDFNNGLQPNGDPANEGYVDIDGGSISVGGDLNNSYGSSIGVDGGGAFAVAGNVTNAQAATITVPDGTFSYGGTMSDPHSGVSASSGDSECADGCCGSGCAALPVSLITFDAVQEHDQVLLSWSTATEKDNDYFTLERSTDGRTFQPIAQVSGNGTSKVIQHYSFIDYLGFASSSTSVYYRLSQTDYDGTFEWLRVIDLGQSAQVNRIQAFPNPAWQGDEIQIEGVTADMSWEIYALSGGLMARGSFISGNRINTQHFKPGTYLLKSFSGSASTTAKIIIR